MTKIAIIIDEDGTFESVYSVDEIELQVLRRGENNNEIDTVEATMEEVEQ